MKPRTQALLVVGMMLMTTGCQSIVKGPASLFSPPASAAKAGSAEESSFSALATSDGKRMPSARLLAAMAKAKEGEIQPGKVSPEAQMKIRDEVRQIYQQALQVDPNHLESLRGLANNYTNLEHYDKALVNFRKALAKHPNDATLWLEYGQCLNRQKDFAGALQAFEKGLEIDVENRQLTQHMGFTLARAGQPEKAIGFLTRSMGAPAAYYNVGRMLVHTKQGDLAKVYLRRSLEENPEFEPAKNLLASLSSESATTTARAQLDVSVSTEQRPEE